VGLAALALLVIVGGLTVYLSLSALPTAHRQASASVLSQQVTANARATTQVRLTATVQVKATADAQIIATVQAQGKPQLLWTFAAGSPISSSPAVVNGIVYVGSNDGKLFAINSVTGQQEWAFATSGLIISRPAVVNGVVYVGCVDHKFYAIAIG
jgi:outer membrane protein assembly factor BamB